MQDGVTRANGARAGRRILMIVNPAAGARRSVRLDAVVDRLRDLGCSVRVVETRAPRDVERLLRDFDSADFDVITAAGGDGTINEVLNDLPPGSPALAILPLGTANVLAREIGLPTTTEAIADTIAFGSTRPVSLGEVNGRRFAVMASVGLDADVVEHVNLNLKRHIGKWAYFFETLRQAAFTSSPVYRIRIDGMEREAHGIIVANGRHYAGRYVAAPNADLEKPALDVCRLTGSGRLAAPSYFMSLFFGRLAGRADVRIEEASDLEILGPAGAPVQGDGDVLCRLPATIRILPAAVDLVFPPARPGALVENGRPPHATDHSPETQHDRDMS